MNKNKQPLLADCEMTDNPICPYCGNEDKDWTDYLMDEGRFEQECVVWCEKCGKEIKVCWETDITFWTYKNDKGSTK